MEFIRLSQRFLKGPQQVDVRGSIFNDVAGDQQNHYHINFNTPLSGYVEEVDEKVDEGNYIPVNMSEPPLSTFICLLLNSCPRTTLILIWNSISIHH
jgi:hypothetical protein